MTTKLLKKESEEKSSNAIEISKYFNKAPKAHKTCETNTFLSSSNDQSKQTTSLNSGNNSNVTIPMGQKPPQLIESDQSDNTEKSISSNETSNVIKTLFP